MTPAELRALLRDALRLWDAEGVVTVEKSGIAIARPDGTWRIEPGPAPARWLLHTPTRAAGRWPRAVPSITALLTALRAALGVPRGASARIGI